MRSHDEIFFFFTLKRVGFFFVCLFCFSVHSISLEKKTDQHSSNEHPQVPGPFS